MALVFHRRVFATLAIFILVLVFSMVSYHPYPHLRYFQLSPLHISTKEQLLAIGDAAEYRHLLSAVNPLEGIPHSKTLGVASRLYVIGLPGREDRQILMGSLQKAMGKQISFNF